MITLLRMNDADVPTLYAWAGGTAAFERLINAFYELGILDPDVDRGTVRDAARSLMAITIRDDVSSRQIQQLVEQVLQTVMVRLPSLIASASLAPCRALTRAQ